MHSTAFLIGLLALTFHTPDRPNPQNDRSAVKPFLPPNAALIYEWPNQSAFTTQHSGIDSVGTLAAHPTGSQPRPGSRLPTVDYQGTAVITSAPVTLGRTNPNARQVLQNNYPFAEQKARFVVNLNRFPAFASTPVFPFVYDGPFFLPSAEFDVLSRGATHVFPSPRLRMSGYFTRQNLPRSKRAVMIGDATVYKLAGIWADQLAQKVGEKDPRVIRLRALHAGPKVDGQVKHRMIIDPATINYMAPFMWDEIKTQGGQGVGVDLVSFDIETEQYPAVENINSPIPPHNGRIADQYRMLGLLYLAVGRIAALEGMPIRIMAYSDGLIEGGGRLWNKEDRSQLSNYLTSNDPNRPYSASEHPYIQALATLGGFVGNGNYSRCTWSHESWYDKDANGKYILENGVRRTRTTDHTGTLYGQQVRLKGIDPKVSNQKEADVAMLFPTYTLSAIQSYGFALNDGQPRRRKSQKTAVFKNVEMSEYLRHDTETLGFAPGNEFGDRPLHPQMIENVVISRSAFTALWFWSAEGPYEFGRDQKGGVSAKGPIEFILKGRHRSQNLLVPFFQKHADYWIGFPFKNYLNEFDGDPNRANAGYAQKFPPLWILSAGRDVLVNACYFAQDENENRELKITHVKLPGWSQTLPLKGRETTFEWLTLPAGITDCDPKDLRLEYTDLMGTKRIVSGDWHYPAN
ncbi:hypothetical protein GCM10027347_21260 [Larkinella harenae]